jgi:phospholipid/cholesterol/gamma-HCH transport system permease protein
MLPLLTFIAMVAGCAGGISVGAFNLDIPQSRLPRDAGHPRDAMGGVQGAIFAVLIALIGCLEAAGQAHRAIGGRTHPPAWCSRSRW